MGYDTRIDWHSPELTALVASGRLPDGRVLDIGCGHGTESRYLAELGWKVTGIDTDDVALRLAQLRRSQLPADVRANIQFKKADAFRFREKNPGTFDIVMDRLLLTNFHHSPRRILLILQTAAYALRKKGLFILRIGLHEHPVRPIIKPREFFNTKSIAFLKDHFDFKPRKSVLLGYNGLTTPCQESGFLVTSTVSMGIMLLKRTNT